MEPGYTVNEQGEKVLVASKRPDGTLRKERRIRAGYTPQDEQPVYQSTGMMSRQNVPKCPGLDPADASAASAAAKSKAAKKNEKRKAKKADGAAGSSSSEQQPASCTPTPRAAPAGTAAPAPAAAASSSTNGPTAAAAAAAAVPGGPEAALDKAIKALNKKLRQCQALKEKQAAGEAISSQEAEKLGKMDAWQEEVRQLEHQLAKLGA